MLADIVRVAREKGVPFGSIQVMDSVHTVANVNVDKDHPRDPGAGWGVKDSWPGKTLQGEPKRDEQGRVVKDKLSFYGYKSHVSLNADAQMITSLRVTAGGAYDGHPLPALLKQDLDQGLEVGTVAADKGPDDGANHPAAAAGEGRALGDPLAGVPDTEEGQEQGDLAGVTGDAGVSAGRSRALQD